MTKNIATFSHFSSGMAQNHMVCSEPETKDTLLMQSSYNSFLCFKYKCMNIYFTHLRFFQFQFFNCLFEICSLDTLDHLVCVCECVHVGGRGWH